jgi:hypothetical protein
LVHSITYEYFHTDLPLLAKKVRDFASDALGMTCSLTIFREIMVLLRKQAELLTFYQDYMIAMNRQMAFQEMDESSEDIKSRVEERVQAFE